VGFVPSRTQIFMADSLEVEWAYQVACLVFVSDVERQLVVGIVESAVAAVLSHAAEVVIVRPVLLEEEDDVLDVFQPAPTGAGHGNKNGLFEGAPRNIPRLHR